MPSVDMFTHMHNWLAFVDAFAYINNPGPEDYLFPGITATGTLHPGEPISHDTIQKWLDKFVESAGIELTGNTKPTTHCFRRGGAQYRFMWALVGKRWTLRTVHWWGGWAPTEDVCFLFELLYSTVALTMNLLIAEHTYQISP